MRENRLRQLWAQDEAAVIGWLGIPSSVSAENMAQAGWDALNVDLQHGLIDYQTMVSMLQAISTTDTMPMARVPWNEPGIIGKVLDAGVMGIICPMINTAADAQALVRAGRYPPLGERSFGPTRAVWYAGSDYASAANESVVLMPMIETRDAIANLDDILSVPGLDGVYVGPGDLGLSHGFVPKLDRDEPELVSLIDHIVERTTAHGLKAGIHCGAPAYARRMIARGYRLVTIQADNALLNAAARHAVAETRKTSSGDGDAGLY